MDFESEFAEIASSSFFYPSWAYSSSAIAFFLAPDIDVIGDCHTKKGTTKQMTKTNEIPILIVLY